ncbi:MAG: hypothetical protein AAGF75_02775 [Cyanobacteria bacterium P01_H01_bin.130]
MPVTNAMTHASLLSQAQQGDALAIEALMNQALRPAGIQARVAVAPAELMVRAIAQTVPDRAFMVNFVRRGMGSLAQSGFQEVIVQGFSQGDRHAHWQVTLILEDGYFVEVQEDSAAEANPDTTPETAAERVNRFPSSSPSPAIAPEFLAESQPDPQPLRDFSESRSPSPQPAAPPTIDPPISPAEPTPQPSTFRRRPPAWQPVAIGLGGWLLSGAIALGLRVVVALLAETRVYTLPYAGPLLQLLEVAELLNLVIFAVLGLGIGLSAIALPKRWGVNLSALVLTLLVPAIFMAGPAVRYQLWLQQVSQAQALVPWVTAEKTDRFLSDHVENQGLFGFYLYTARYSKLPILAEDMRGGNAIDDQVNSTIADAARVSTQEVAQVLEWGTWGIRGFYFLVATFAAASHFRQAIAIRRE